MKKALYFPGAGVNFFWQAGVGKYLQENIDLKNIIIIGASAGSLTSSLLYSNVNFDTSVHLAHNYVENLNLRKNPFGLAGIWGNLVRQWLNELIPSNINSSQIENLHILITPLTLPLYPIIVSNLHNKQEVIDACMASSHLPFFMDGNLSIKYKNQNYIDGSICCYFRQNIPLPPTVTSIYKVDFCRDHKFQCYCLAPGKLITKQQAFDMMEYGYNFMKLEHKNGNLHDFTQ